jgi:hypothetical protein
MDGVICPSGKRWRALIGTCRPQPADPRYSPILRSCRKVAPHGLLPNVRVHILGNLLLFFCRKRWRRQTGENFVENEDLDVRLGLLLLPESIQLFQPDLNFAGNTFAIMLASIGIPLARSTSTAAHPLRPLPPIAPDEQSCSGHGGLGLSKRTALPQVHCKTCMGRPQPQQSVG